MGRVPGSGRHPGLSLLSQLGITGMGITDGKTEERRKVAAWPGLEERPAS